VSRRCRHRRERLPELATLQSLVCARPVEVLGSPHPLCPRCFQRRWRFLPFAVPRSLAQTGSSSRELRSPIDPFSRPSDISRYRPPSLGFAVPSSRPQPAASLRRESRSRRPPPSTFLTSSTVSSAAGLVGLFHPTATSRVRSSGASPPSQPSRLVDVSCPLVVGQAPLPKLPSAPRPSAPPSGLSSVPESVASQIGFTRPVGSLPS